MRILNIKKVTVAVIVIAAVQTACKKPLYETEPIGRDINYTFDVLDSIGTQAEGFLTDIYASGIPRGYNRIANDVLDAGSDDAVSSASSTQIERFLTGQISPVNVVDGVWENSYSTIRKVNIFLANIDKVPHKDPQVITFWKTEARLLRAIAYFEMIKRYGGVPMIGDKVLTVDDDLELAKNSYEECVEYIVKECDEVIPLARPIIVAENNGDYGRLHKGVAYALKARVLLYAASKLNNPSNDAGKWARAAQASKDLIDLNIYALDPIYLNVFVGISPEVILSRTASPNSNLETLNAPIGYTGTVESSGRTSPTQELVDAFGMVNGKAIKEAGSGYNPASPYDNRDPRFYHTIFFDGVYWLNRPIETFDGGLDRPVPAKNVQTRTGYYMRKFLWDGYNGAGARPTQYIEINHNFPVFRYAEVLLNYAEAINEAANNASNRQEAINQLIALRERAGIAKGSTPGYDYGLKLAMNQAELREAIRNERRVEMAFEEQRFWDIRRWKIAEEVLNGSLHGVRITKTGTGASAVYSYDFNDEVLKVNFEPKMYHYPFPLSEILKNQNLIQPEGWQN